MPIHDRTYARMPDRGVTSSRPRFLAIARYGSKYVRRTKMFWFFVVASWVPAFVWIVVIYGSEESGEFVLNELKMLSGFSAADYRKFVADYAMQFLQLQAYAVTLLAALTGGGAIAEDARRHALELYATRPITGLTYLAGKWFGVFSRLLLVLLYPILAVFAVAFGFLPRCLETCWPVALASAGAAIFMSACYAIVVLGVSASVRSSRYAVVLWFIVAFFTMVASLVLVRVTGEAGFEALSFRFAIEHVASFILGAELAALPFVDPEDRSLLLSSLALCIWFALALGLLARRLRHARSG